MSQNIQVHESIKPLFHVWSKQAKFPYQSVPSLTTKPKKIRSQHPIPPLISKSRTNLNKDYVLSQQNSKHSQQKQHKYTRLEEHPLQVSRIIFLDKNLKESKYENKDIQEQQNIVKINQTEEKSSESYNKEALLTKFYANRHINNKVSAYYHSESKNKHKSDQLVHFSSNSKDLQKSFNQSSQNSNKKHAILYINGSRENISQKNQEKKEQILRKPQINFKQITLALYNHLFEQKTLHSLLSRTSVYTEHSQIYKKTQFSRANSNTSNIEPFTHSEIALEQQKLKIRKIKNLLSSKTELKNYLKELQQKILMLNYQKNRQSYTKLRQTIPEKDLQILHSSFGNNAESEQTFILEQGHQNNPQKQTVIRNNKQISKTINTNAVEALKFLSCLLVKLQPKKLNVVYSKQTQLQFQNQQQKQIVQKNRAKMRELQQQLDEKQMQLQETKKQYDQVVNNYAESINNIVGKKKLKESKVSGNNEAETEMNNQKKSQDHIKSDILADFDAQQESVSMVPEFKRISINGKQFQNRNQEAQTQKLKLKQTESSTQTKEINVIEALSNQMPSKNNYERYTFQKESKVMEMMKEDKSQSSKNKEKDMHSQNQKQKQESLSKPSIPQQPRETSIS